MTTITISETAPVWVTASLIDENKFYLDEKARFVDGDCKHRIKNGQCLLRKNHIGKHIVTFNKGLLNLLITNNILVKMMRANWRVT